MIRNSSFCPEFHKAVELIGKRWSGAVVREIMAGATRFTGLMADRWIGKGRHVTLNEVTGA